MNETDYLPPEPVFTFTPIQAGKADADLIPLSRESKFLTPSPTMRVTAAIWMTAVKSLRSVATNNLDYIRITTSTEDRLSNRFYHCFNHLLEDVEIMQPIIEKLNENAYKFDFERVPANGFRSLLSVTDTCMCRLVQTSRVIESRRDALFARRNVLLKDLEEYTKVLGSLRVMLVYADHMMDQADQTGSVFPKEGSKLIEEWFQEVETLNQEVFYGRSLGFQFASSVNRTLQTIALAMAVCAETYRSWEKWKPGSARIANTLPNLFSTTRLIMKSDIRAKEIVHTTRNADINFCKQFWSLTEASYLQSVNNWILPTVLHNQVIELPPEMLEVSDVNGKGTVLKPPDHNKPIYTRFISDIPISGNTEKPHLSPYLLFHCHGGGFIAQSSKSHEVYLIKWAKDLKIPIFSVDYALAPEHPYPKGLDEVVYAYAWALKNHEKLGWTGEKVCFVGDSAGANLVVSAALKISCKNLTPPTGIVACYGAFLVQYTPSPSRLLCLMDPILPMGILTRCLAAYAGVAEPTSVGQVQGADDRVSETNIHRNASAHDFEAEHHTDTADGSAHHIEPHDPDDHCPDIVSDVSHHPSSPNHVPKTSHWFGKGVMSLFKKKKDAFAEDPNVAPHGPLEAAATKGNSDRGDETRVEPLPRYNFASVSVEDPFLSPLLAEDHILEGLPPIHLMACHLDPLLDDSISFARRLSQLKKPVKLEVFNKLPHGFLNFSVFSPEAAQATEICAQRIAEVLEMTPKHLA